MIETLVPEMEELTIVLSTQVHAGFMYKDLVRQGKEIVCQNDCEGQLLYL